MKWTLFFVLCYKSLFFEDYDLKNNKTKREEREVVLMEQWECQQSELNRLFQTGFVNTLFFVLDIFCFRNMVIEINLSF